MSQFQTGIRPPAGPKQPSPLVQAMGKPPIANALSPLGGKALPGTPMPPNPYSGPSNVFNANTAPMGYMSPKPGAPMATPQSPLQVAGTRTLQDAGTGQHMGAGSVMGAGGTPKWWDGTQPSNVMPATNSKSLEAWKDKNMSPSIVREKLANRQATHGNFVSTGGATTSPLVTALRSGGQPPAPPSPPSPFMTAMGLNAPKGPSASFNNYRASEMMKKQANILGTDGLQGAIGMGGAMLQHGADNQHQMALARMQQAGQLHPADQARVNLATSLLGNPNMDPDKSAAIYGHADNMLQGMRGTQQVPNSPLLPPGQGPIAGASGQQQSLADILRQPGRTNLPEGVGAMPVDQQFNHVRAFDAANPNLSPAERTRHFQKAGVDENAIKSHAMGLLRPGMMGSLGAFVSGPFQSPAAAYELKQNQDYAKKIVGKGEKSTPRQWWEKGPQPQVGRNDGSGAGVNDYQ